MKIDRKKLAELLGQKQSVSAIARALGVSRAAVRKAMRKVSPPGTLQVSPGTVHDGEGGTSTNPVSTSAAQVGNNTTTAIPVCKPGKLSMHKTCFYVEFEGAQPFRGGRKARMQHWNAFHFEEETHDFKIVSTPKGLRLLFRRAFEGTPSSMQWDAEDWARRHLSYFAAGHGLKLKWETFRKETSSDYVFENEGLSAALEPLVAAGFRTRASELVQDKSHPGRVEFKDREDAKRDKKAVKARATDKAAVKGWEYWLFKLPRTLVKEQRETKALLEVIAHSQARADDRMAQLIERLEGRPGEPRVKRPAWEGN